ncbi:MAG: TIGR03643 family protein [Salibacteraceae bacterium]
MGKTLIEKYNLSQEAVDRIIGMAWEDRTPFEAIEFQFGLSEAEVIQLMKLQMHPRNWKKWRARVQGRKTKHQKLREKGVDRFRSKNQRSA